MLSAGSAEPFDSPLHIFEVIWHGVRALLFAQHGRVRIQDRFGRDVTVRFPELQVPPSHLRRTGVVLDGVIVSLDHAGRPDFARLYPRLTASTAAEAERRAAEAPIVFQAFDILYRDGLSVMDRPLLHRKALLRETVRWQGPVLVPDFVERDGVAFFEVARDHGLEGIIAKRKDSTYTPGERSRSWLTMRVYQRDEFVIAGYTYGGPIRVRVAPSARLPLTSLLLGQYDAAGVLHFAGEVNGGFDSGMAEAILSAVDPLVCRDSPFASHPVAGRLVFWCRPELACTVRFAGRDAGGILRFPLFEWLRPDIPARSCRLPEGRP